VTPELEETRYASASGDYKNSWDPENANGRYNIANCKVISNSKCNRGITGSNIIKDAVDSRVNSSSRGSNYIRVSSKYASQDASKFVDDN